MSNDRSSTVILLLLAVAASFSVISCKREQRLFRVDPYVAKTSDGAPNTPFQPGGTLIAATEPTPRILPPNDIDANAYDLAQGQKLYAAMNCAGCHGAHGGGAIGPALSDDKWIYGFQPEIIFDTIVHGRPNGMPSFGDKISSYQVWQIVGYVRSLSGLASPQAAPGRSDELAASIPPNSIPAPHPQSERTQLDALGRSDQERFRQMGWVDSESNRIKIPGRIIEAVEQLSATQPSQHR